MEAGVAVATAFAFSTENWKRDAHEVSILLKFHMCCGTRLRLVMGLGKKWSQTRLGLLNRRVRFYSATTRASVAGVRCVRLGGHHPRCPRELVHEDDQ